MRAAWIAVFACVAIGAVESTSSSAQGDATSCSVYNTGLKEMDDGNLNGAIESFKRVIAGCTQVETQAKAWLQVGRIGLKQWPVDLSSAKGAADRLTTSPYLNTPSAADGFILRGIIELTDGRNFANALTEFKRVDKNVTRSIPAIAEAQYRIGETQRLNHQTEAALRTFQDIPQMYPRTEWAARALIAAAACQTRLGDFRGAMESLQRVRRDSPGSPEAELALQRNTILYRLYLKGKSQELVPVMTSKKKYREGVALGIDRQGRILLGHRDGLVRLNGDSGDEVSAEPLTANTSFAVTAVGMWGSVTAVARDRLIVFDGTKAPFRPVTPKPDGTVDDVEVAAFVANWRGEWLIADSKSGSLRKFLPDGKPNGVLPARIKAERMAQNDLDNVAVLDGNEKSVLVLNRDGTVSGQIARRDKERQYEFDSPVDVAFDILGNVYVLDEGRNSILVFDPSLQFRTSLTFPLKTIRKAVGLAIDERGRIYVLDRDGQQILGYQ
jgi:outer membrane protein assembly factor BamD (BamD/ComL family)